MNDPVLLLELIFSLSLLGLVLIIWWSVSLVFPFPALQSSEQAKSGTVFPLGGFVAHFAGWYP